MKAGRAGFHPGRWMLGVTLLVLAMLIAWFVQYGSARRLEALAEAAGR